MKIFIAVATAISFVAVPASAASKPVPQVGVSFDDLDLTKPVDLERLERRIDHAVRKVCATGMRGVAARQHELNCREVALAAVEEPKRMVIANAHRGRLRLAAMPAAGQGS